MAGMGPAPKDPDKRARQNPSVAMTKLPAHGRKGRPPAWPLGADVALETLIGIAKSEVKEFTSEVDAAATARGRAAARRKLARAKTNLVKHQAEKTHQRNAERKVWTDLWKTPQATQWERLCWTRDIAQYVRHKVKAEGGSIDDAKEARQQADRLGLTPMSLLRLRWEIVDSEPSGRRSPSPRGGPSGSRSRRGHLSAVPSGKPAASGQ